MSRKDFIVHEDRHDYITLNQQSNKMYLPFYFYLHTGKTNRRQNTIDERCHRSKGNVTALFYYSFTPRVNLCKWYFSDFSQSVHINDNNNFQITSFFSTIQVLLNKLPNKFFFFLNKNWKSAVPNYYAQQSCCEKMQILNCHLLNFKDWKNILTGQAVF